MQGKTKAWPTKPDASTTDPDSILGPIPGLARCDRCGSAAYVSALFVECMTALYFCGSHYRQHEAAIVAQATEIRDERHRLTVAANAHRPIVGVTVQ